MNIDGWISEPHGEIQVRVFRVDMKSRVCQQRAVLYVPPEGAENTSNSGPTTFGLPGETE